MAAAAAAATTVAASVAAASRSRGVAKLFEAVSTPEGMGANVRRSIGSHMLRNLDPFLMLDEATITPPAGFPDHPHRGFETVSYLLRGKMSHEDMTGRRGVLNPGDMQWMTAGRGIYHSELPMDGLECQGLQLWINLPAKHKMCDPQYQEYAANEIPVAKQNGATAFVIAGEALGTQSPLKTRIPVHYIRFKIEPHQEIFHPFPSSWNGFIYVISGSGTFGAAKTGRENVKEHHAIVFDKDGDGIRIATNDTALDAVFLGGEPIGEPIVQYGPVVMNTREEIQQAFRDIQLGKNGFEKAVGWESEQSRRYLAERRAAGDEL